MKKVFKFIFFLFLWIFLTTLIVIGMAGLGYAVKTGLFISLGIFIAYHVIKKLIQIQYSKSNVSGLIHVERQDKKRSGIFSWKTSSKNDVTKIFRLTLKRIKKSNLRKMGNPVYALPWYLMMGPGGSGKTIALENAHLPSPVLDDEYSPRTGLNWKIYNQSMVIDTPGKFFESQGSDTQGWRTLIKMLKWYRSREPLNGVIMVLDAHSLLTFDKNQLVKLGRECRARLEELSNSLRLDLPVYMMVTQCDHMDGFSSWAASLPESTRDQVVGFAKGRNEESITEFIQDGFGQISEKIKDAMMVAVAANLADKQFLLLPSSLELLSKRLTIFSKEAFSENPFQEAPMFRGVYLSAALTDTQLKKEGQQGLFLHSFFVKILPNDRYMVRAATGKKKKALRFRLSCLGVWALIVAASFAGLVFFYANNLGYLQRISKQYAGAFVSHNILTEKIEKMVLMGKMVSNLEAETRSWPFPWFGYYNEPDFIRELKQIYSEKFRFEILTPMDTAFFSNSGTGPKGTPKKYMPEETAARVGALSHRINILDSYLKGMPMGELEKMPPPFGFDDIFVLEKISDYSLDNLNHLYFQSLYWFENRDEISEEMARLRAALSTIFDRSQKDLSWIIPLANKKIKNNPLVDIEAYWSGTGSIIAGYLVPSAFTIEGKNYIENFLSNLMAVDPESKEMKQRKSSFEDQYRKQYYNAWKAFSLNFDLGINKLQGRGEFLNAVDLLTTTANPYFQALETMATQLAPFLSQPDCPPWVKLSHFFKQLTLLGKETPEDTAARDKLFTKIAVKMIAKLGPLGKSISKSAKKGLKTQKKLDKARPDPQLDSLLEDGAVHLDEYQKSLVEIAFSSGSKSVSLAAMKNVFINSDHPEAGTGPEARAMKAIHSFEMMLGKRSQRTEPFWHLYAGPMMLVYDYMKEEAASLLQEKWEKDFLVQIENVPQYKLSQLIFGPEGKIWEYINTNAAPFIERAVGKGWTPVTVKTYTMPFSSKFIELISRGNDTLQSRPDKYLVTLNPLPISVNPEATILPSALHLRLQCGEQYQVIDNYNFAASADLSWTDKCGDLLLTFELGSLFLEKSYAGPKGFPLFLKDFEFGRKRYIPKDFPIYQSHLDQMDIRWIEARYNISGHRPVIDTLKNIPFQIPKKIITSWVMNPIRKKPAAKKQKERIGKSTSHRKIYIVEAATFFSLGNADKTVGKLRKRGWPAGVYWLEKKDGTKFFVVYAGVFDSFEKAKEKGKELKDKEQISPLIRTSSRTVLEQRKQDI